MTRNIYKKAPVYKLNKPVVVIEDEPVIRQKKEVKHSKNYYKTKKLFFGNGEKDGLIYRIFLYAFLIVLSYVFLQPIIKMIFTSFMSNSDMIDPEVVYVPKAFTFNNYVIAVSVMDYWKSLLNSIWFSLLLAVLQTIVSAFAGYAFARYEFKGKKFWYALLIVTFIIPIQVMLVPRRMMITSFQNMTDGNIIIMGTIIPQILFTILGQGVYSTVLILIFINFFKQIPVALDEAAVMDGATTFQTFYHVILKLSAPIIFTVFLFSFVWNWNDTTNISFFLGDKLELLPQQLSKFDNLFAGAGTGNKSSETFKMAGSILSILPLIILYVFVQKQFVEGIENTGMTGQ